MKITSAGLLMLWVICALNFYPQQAYAHQSDGSLEAVAPRLPTAEAIRRLKKDIPRLMKEANVPGISAALIRNGKLVWSGAFGVLNADTKQVVTSKTIFDVNSLSKPAFGYAVLRLVDDGKLKLDTPLNSYLDDKRRFSNDPRIDLVTARMLLSHTSGLQQGPSDTDKLHFAFQPGEKFQYAPVGITYLSKVVEQITGMKTEDFMQDELLTPLGMEQSSYIWKNTYDSLRAYRHDWQGHVKGTRYKWKQGAACCSLQSNAEDYSKLVIAVLNGKLLKKATWSEMMKPQISLNTAGAFWGLGWALEKSAQGESFWHWGDSQFSKDYIIAGLQHKDALIFLANGENGLSFMKEILNDALGGEHPGLDYLGYPHYNAADWTLLKAIIAKGAPAAMDDYLSQRNRGSKKTLTEAQLNNVGYRLLGINKYDEAIAVLSQNTVDFSLSANAWDSLAEAYMDKGDNQLAIKYYEKSLSLNPGNTNAVDQLKKLKSK